MIYLASKVLLFMKKILLSVTLLCSFALCSVGQTFTTQYASNGDTAIVAYTSNPEIEVKNLIQNITNDDITLKWKIVDHNLTGSAWVLGGFCDNITCYTNTADLLAGNAKTTNPILANSNIDDFHAILDGTNAPSNSFAWVQVEVTDEAAHYSRFLTFIATRDLINNVSTVLKSSDDGVVLFPIPARNKLNLVFRPELGVKSVAIYNLIGKPVSSFKVNDKNISLEIGNIPSGIYYVRMMDAQGRVVATRKFTKQ
jgi:hypothetical protein